MAPNTASATVLTALRGDRARRPPLDLTSAAGLRAELDDAIFAVLGEVAPATPIVVTAARLRHAPGATALEAGPSGRLRGVLVTQLVRLLGVGASVDSPFEAAVAAWRAQRPSPDLLEHLTGLDADARARLDTDVTAHFVTLARSLGPVPPAWTVRSAQRASVRLGAGRVVLRDTVDLVVGSALSSVTSVALLDVTTSPLCESAERAARYHALVETLRTSSVPLRTAVLSTATGDLWRYDVDRDLLLAGVADVSGAIARIAEAP